MRLSFLLAAIWFLCRGFATAWLTLTPFQRQRRQVVKPLSFSWWDGLVGDFFQKRLSNDFVKLNRNDSNDVFGPGPLLILYRVPLGIDNDEIYDMLEDTAPQAFQQGVRLARIHNENERKEVLDMPLSEALDTLVMSSGEEEASSSRTTTTAFASTVTPVLFFSGFSNREMMEAYDLLGSEIYQESQQAAACAKAVPNAMAKSLWQVLDEICGDHEEAMIGLAEAERLEAAEASQNESKEEQ